MLDKQDVELLRGVIREEIGNPANLDSFRVVMREEIESSYSGQAFHEAVSREFSGEAFQNSVRKIVHEEVGEIIEEVVLPKFDEVYERFDKVDERFAKLETRTANIELNMVTKDFLEDRLADFKVGLKNSAGSVGTQLKRLTSEMHKGGLLSGEQVIAIHA